MPDQLPALRPRSPGGPPEPKFDLVLRAAFVAATAVALTAVFWPGLWQGGGLIGGDVYAYYLPQKAFYAERLREGTLPLWNNRIGNGYPQLAESQTGALYPVNLALYRWLDLNTACNASVLFHYSLAFVGCWLLARRMGLVPMAAGFTALIYTYGWFPPRISLEWTIVTGAWLPWALWFVESYLQERNSRWLVALAGTLAVQLLAGHFLIAFLTHLLIVIYVPLRLWFRQPEEQDVAPSVGALRISSWLLAAIAGSYVLAAMQLLPTWELKNLSQRAGTDEGHDPAYGAVPPRYLTQVVAPWAWYPDRETFAALHDPPHDPQQRPPNRVDAHLYFGMLPLPFMAVGLWGAWRDGNRRLFAWLAIGIAAILYMPGWLLPVTRHLPGFSFFEGPGRYGIVATLAAALLAGAGFQAVGQRFKPLVRPLYAAAIFIVTAIDLMWVAEMVHDAEPVENPPVKLLAQSPMYARNAANPTEPVRMFSEAYSVPSLVGAGTLPVYLGLGPAQYFDPRLTLQKPYPFRDRLPTKGQLDWLQRMGVTHILSLTELDGQVWPVSLLWIGPDECLNGPLAVGSQQILLVYELEGSRGRAAWLENETGPRPRIVKYQPQRVEIDAVSERGGTLVLTDLDYPGWQVEVDGRPTAGVVVDGMLRGVAVPAGQHTVTWIYRPASFFWGAGISVAALVVLITLAIPAFRRTK
ncbi:MAG: YfhO family protein [Planctomycetia bacterium]|nr:YfhO family protein [Planctomycetia bacterium]